jgi:hypothetical protein
VIRLLPVIAVAAALALVAPAPALADGDPASDVLLLQDVYLPYAPGVPGPLGSAITTLLKTTRKAGFALKVAIIATPQDLGAVPQFFGKPQQYAPFLQREIAFNSKVPLLVVMAAGYGAAGLPAGTDTALQGLKPPANGGGDALGRSAIDGILRLAKAGGHPVAAPKLVSAGGGGGASTSPVIVFGVPVALLAIGGVLAALRRRQTAPADESRP